MFTRKMLSELILVLAFSFFTVAYSQENETGKEKAETETHQMHHKMIDEKNAANPWNEVCPVRGGKVQKETALVEYNNKQYGFCCPGCDNKFADNPGKYSKI